MEGGHSGSSREVDKRFDSRNLPGLVPAQDNVSGAIPMEIRWEKRQGSRKMAGPTGLEPATSGVTGQRSNQLSYGPFVILSNGLRPHPSGHKRHRSPDAAPINSSSSARSTGEL